MSNVERIHRGKQPRRPHFIEEWANVRGFEKAVDLATALEADKSVVSRWYSGASPSEDYQRRLATLFHCEPESLFRHPDDDWISRFFRDRDREEVERMKKLLLEVFPKQTRTGTDG